MKAIIRSFVPSSLRQVAARAKDALLRSRYRRKLEALPNWSAVNGVKVCYGGVLKEAAASGILQGGKVKLLDLQQDFPEHHQGFNILYLVSSALPQYPGELVRWAKRRGARFVLNQNGVFYPGWAGPEWEKLNVPNRELLAMADLVVYQSKYCRFSADKHLGQAPGKNVILYNAIDTSEFSPGEQPKRSSLVLLVAGSHQQPQRVLSVIEALTLLVHEGVSVSFILAGKLGWPNALAHVRQEIKDRNLSKHIEITGPYRREEAAQLYQRADILVHTKYKDPCPTVVIEAMACGLAVVGSASGGMPELVGDEAGILLPVSETWNEIPVPDAKALAGAIRDINTDLQRWQHQARARAVSHFDVEHWLVQHRELFSAEITQTGNAEL